jgi:perosamine synthetase
MIFTTLSPNTQKDDLVLYLKSLLKFWSWKEKKYETLFKNSFKKKLELNNVFLLDSARNSLYIFLKSLNLKKNDEVLLQAYTCVALVNPVLWAGLKPVYIDCNLKNFNISLSDLEKKITKKSKVLIIQHTFGLPAKMEKIQQICKKNNLILIEDCAHSLGAKHKDKFTGGFGDAAIFSFGRDKVISCTSGGALVINNSLHLTAIKKIYSKLKYPNKIWTFQQLIQPLILAIAKPTYNFFKIGRIIIRISILCKIITKPIQKEEFSGIKPKNKINKLSPILGKILSLQLSKLDSYNEHRVDLAKLYSSQLDKKFSPPNPKNQAENIFLRYTIMVDEPKKIYNLFLKKGIQLGSWFDSVIIPKNTNLNKIKYTLGSCPNAEFLGKHSLNLPNGINTNKKNAIEISKQINILPKN